MENNIINKPPVVVILGHIDHGKTSLLMAIKDFKVLEKETGGITQHVGAYQIEHNSKKITFLDTPGHESFSAIRSRGSKVADIAILVIDSAEGIKKQTKEAINHIKAANLSMIVALNKIDKPNANPEMVKRELLNEDVVVESLGGKVPVIEISAKTGQGIPDLLDLIQLISEMNNLQVDLSKKAEGVIIESFLDARRGITVTALSEQGILKAGDVIGTDSAIGKIKSLESFQKKEIKEAYPSDPIIIIGFEKMPAVGETFSAFESFEEAEANLKEKKQFESSFKILEEEPDKKYLNLIVKADATGSLEAIEEVFKSIPQEKAIIKVNKAEAGNVNESDVRLAKATQSIIIAFRVKKDKVADISSQKEKVKILDYDLIYSLAQKIREIIEKKSINKEKQRIDLGRMETTVIFRTEKNRQIIGGKVIEGEMEKGAMIEILREEEKIGTGKIIDLQVNKKSFDVIKAGKECAILYQGSERIKEGDELLAFKEEIKEDF